MLFSFSNLKSPKEEGSLKGTGSSCNNRTFTVMLIMMMMMMMMMVMRVMMIIIVVVAVEVLIGSLSNYDDDFKKTIGLMIKTTALNVHHSF